MNDRPILVTGPIARRKSVIMRKEIVPKLKAHLEQHG